MQKFQILSSEDPYYREQSSCGERFKVGTDYFVFRTRSVAVEFLVSFNFDFALENFRFLYGRFFLTFDSIFDAVTKFI